MIRRTLSGAGIFALLAAGAWGDTPENPPASRIDARVAQCVLQTYARPEMPGVSAAIATETGVVWTGVAEAGETGGGGLLDEASLLPVGSITKVYISVITLQLAHAGQLSLTDTVADILGREADGIANAGTATVASLLNHTSGIPSWEDDPDWIADARGARLDPGRTWRPLDALDYIRGAPALFPAGERYAYSNTDHTLLGQIIEKVTGMSLTDVLDERIRGPLGLRETFLEGHESLRDGHLARRFHHETLAFLQDAGRPPGAQSVPGGLFEVSHTNLSSEWAAGGMVATAREVAEFGRALSTGRLLTMAAQDWMESFRDIDAPWAAQAYGPGGSIRTGYGVFFIGTDDFAVMGHSGDVLGGSAALFWNAEENYTVSLFANVGSMHTGGGQASAGRDFFSNPLLRDTARSWGHPIEEASPGLQAFLAVSCR